MQHNDAVSVLTQVAIDEAEGRKRMDAQDQRQAAREAQETEYYESHERMSIHKPKGERYE